jgi:hypothetical protein|tara:strand:+ start:514 stop:615 length:102 start_codon:yes stop_codon:yes gene_type:complete
MTKLLNIPPAWMGLVEFAFFVVVGTAAGSAGLI